MEFLSLSRRSSSCRKILSGEEQGETAVFAGYSSALFVLCYSLTTLATPINSALNPTIIGFERSMTGRKRRRFVSSYTIWFSNRRSWVSFPALYSVKHRDQNINKHFCLVVRNVNWIKCWVFFEYTKNPASYPDVSLLMKMCAQRKAGRRQRACCLYPSHGPLRFITSHSRFALASAMRKTKRLRRRLLKTCLSVYKKIAPSEIYYVYEM